MFEWAGTLGVDGLLSRARAAAGPVAHSLPSWIRFSLPDALWAFAVTSLMSLTWKHKLTRESAAWILAGPFLAVGSELGQAAHVVPGTFDVTDLALLVVASGLGLCRVRTPCQGAS